MESVLRIDVTAILGSIAVPTLVLHRVDEPLPVAQARVAAAAITGARLVEMPGGDHLPWLGDAARYLDEIEEFLTGARRAPAPERVLTTVLFADVVSSTEAVAAMGDHAWRQLLDRYEARVREVIARVDGREVFTKGDEFFIAFSGPARAVECGLRMQSVAQDVGLAIRVGVHIGECELRGDDLAGIAVHIASRVMSGAEPGELLVTSTVRDLMVGGGFRFIEKGRRKLKGVPDEWAVFAVPSEVDEPVAHEPALSRTDRATIGLIRRMPQMSRRYSEWQLKRAEQRKSRETAAATP
jgi:class 3 adenylate cyclase